MISLLHGSLLAQQSVPTPVVEWFYLVPIVVLALGGILLITLTSIAPATRHNHIPALFTVICGIGGLVSVAFIAERLNELANNDAAGALAIRPRVNLVSSALVADHFTVWITGLICVSVILVAILLDSYLPREGLDAPEWYALLLISASGGLMLAAAEDLVVTFIGLEILSIAVYVLASLHLRRTESQEAGFKYFILGALSSAVFLYGIALVYGATGSTRLSQIADSMDGVNAAGLSPENDSSLIMVGMALLLVGFGFKVSAFPFHVWTPDVYQGSPTPIVGFMTSAVKVAAFAGMMRVFLIGFGGTFAADWRVLVMCMAALTILLGSFLAIVQTNVKRTMAYSSIVHAGFMLVGLYAAASPLSLGEAGSRSVLFYLLAYTFMSIGTFAVITIVGQRGDGNHSLDDYRGLGKRQPVLASAFVVLLFGQVGAPFTAGFFAKFRVIAAAANVDQTEGYILAAIAMLGSAVGAFLYLRIVVAMFLEDSEPSIEDAESEECEQVVAQTMEVPAGALAVAVATALVTILLGVFPDIGSGALAEAAQAFGG